MGQNMSTENRGGILSKELRAMQAEKTQLEGETKDLFSKFALQGSTYCSPDASTENNYPDSESELSNLIATQQKEISKLVKVKSADEAEKKKLDELANSWGQWFSSNVTYLWSGYDEETTPQALSAAFGKNIDEINGRIKNHKSIIAACEIRRDFYRAQEKLGFVTEMHGIMQKFSKESDNLNKYLNGSRDHLDIGSLIKNFFISVQPEYSEYREDFGNIAKTMEEEQAKAQRILVERNYLRELEDKMSVHIKQNVSDKHEMNWSSLVVREQLSSSIQDTEKKISSLKASKEAFIKACYTEYDEERLTTEEKKIRESFGGIKNQLISTSPTFQETLSAQIKEVMVDKVIKFLVSCSYQHMFTNQIFNEITNRDVFTADSVSFLPVCLSKEEISLIKEDLMSQTTEQVWRLDLAELNQLYSETYQIFLRTSYYITKCSEKIKEKWAKDKSQPITCRHNDFFQALREVFDGERAKSHDSSEEYQSAADKKTGNDHADLRKYAAQRGLHLFRWGARHVTRARNLLTFLDNPRISDLQKLLVLEYQLVLYEGGCFDDNKTTDVSAISGVAEASLRGKFLRTLLNAEGQPNCHRFRKLSSSNKKGNFYGIISILKIKYERKVKSQNSSDLGLAEQRNFGHFSNPTW